MGGMISPPDKISIANFLDQVTKFLNEAENSDTDGSLDIETAYGGSLIIEQGSEPNILFGLYTGEETDDMDIEFSIIRNSAADYEIELDYPELNSEERTGIISLLETILSEVSDLEINPLDSVIEDVWVSIFITYILKGFLKDENLLVRKWIIKVGENPS